MKDAAAYARRVFEIEPGELFLHSAKSYRLDPAEADRARDELCENSAIFKVCDDLFYRAPVNGRKPYVSEIIRFYNKRGEKICMGGPMEAAFIDIAPPERDRRLFLTSGASRSFEYNGCAIEIISAPDWLLRTGREGIAARIVWHYGADREILSKLAGLGYAVHLRPLVSNRDVAQEVKDMILEVLKGVEK